MSYANFHEHRAAPPPVVPFSAFTAPVQFVGQSIYEALELVAKAIASLAAFFERKAREHRAVGRLTALDDRTLQDIGLSRSEIRYISRQVSAYPGFDHRSMSDR